MFSNFSVKLFTVSSRFWHSLNVAAYTLNTVQLNTESLRQVEVYHNEQDNNLSWKDYRMEFAKPADTEKILRFMKKNYFCEEPLSRSLHLCNKKLDKALEFYIKESLAQGMTIIARENSTDSEIMGVAINQKSCPWDGDRLVELASVAENINARKLMNIWALIAREPAMHEYLSQLVIFDLKFITVKKSLEGQGLESELSKRSLSLGRDLNYNFARIDATNAATRSIAENFKMEKLWDVPYTNVLSDDGKSPVTDPGRLDTHAAVYYMNLKTMPEERLIFETKTELEL